MYDHQFIKDLARKQSDLKASIRSIQRTFESVRGVTTFKDDKFDIGVYNTILKMINQEKENRKILNDYYQNPPKKKRHNREHHTKATIKKLSMENRAFRSVLAVAVDDWTSLNDSGDCWPAGQMNPDWYLKAKEILKC